MDAGEYCVSTQDVVSILYGLTADDLPLGCYARMGPEQVQNLKHELTSGAALQRVNVCSHHLA